MNKRVQSARLFRAGAPALFLALIAYVPLLVVRRGIVTSDTKTYLYLDPARFLSQVASMWNPDVALGTTTHEYVGYLFPMGTFFALGAQLHIPIWVTQRLWLGTIVFLAGLGLLWCGRVLRLNKASAMVGALFYLLTPYVLQYSGRISVILLPYCALPWLIALTVRALERPGWRCPALFALVGAAASGINASSILYVMVGPTVVVLVELFTRQVSLRRAVVSVGEAVIFFVVLSAWWIAGLFIEAGYGVDVLRYTETVRATSTTDSPAEAFRGLGYWYFYGGGRSGPWNDAIVDYTQWLWLVVVSFLAPLFAIAVSFLAPRRLRVIGILLVIVGVILSVGAYPYHHPSLWGSLVKYLMLHTTAGLAMRSTDRATPLVVMGLALLLAGGIDALLRRRRWLGIGTGVVAIALIIAANPAYFNGQAAVTSGQIQPAQLPHYERAAMAYLNKHRTNSRVLGIPGNNFAAYNFGDTIDTPQPGLLTRSFVTREQQVMGSQATADLLYGFDAPMQEGLQNTNAIAPMARLIGAGDVLVEYDQTATRYGIVQPRVLAAALRSVPPGLREVKVFGGPVKKPVPVSRTALATPTPLALSHKLVDYSVRTARPFIRAESNKSALIVDGDASALTTLAGEALLTTKSAIYYAGTLDSHPAQEKTLARNGATLVVTDTNADQAFQWNSLSANTGFIETATQQIAQRTPSDYPVTLFPGAPMTSKTVALFHGAQAVSASSYGNPLNNTPEDQPEAAVDGLTTTAWETGTYLRSAKSQWWQVSFSTPTTLHEIRLLQPQKGTLSRWITEVTFSFGHTRKIKVPLTAASRTAPGQLIRFPATATSLFRITIDKTAGKHGAPGPATPVGFAQITFIAHPIAESIAVPTDLLSALGKSSQKNRLIFSFKRDRVASSSPRHDPEPSLTRTFTLPTQRSFVLNGTASLSSLLGDSAIDAALSRTLHGVVATSSSRLPGDLQATASATLDHTPTTWWQSDLGRSHVEGASLSYTFGHTFGGGALTIKAVADATHSTPRRVTVSLLSPSGTTQEIKSATFSVPRHRSNEPTYVTTTLTLAPSDATKVVLRFSDIAGLRKKTVTTNKVATLPLAIATVTFAGLSPISTTSSLTGVCQNNLLSIDGQSVSVAIVGSTQAASSSQTVIVQGCGADADGITLSAGTHTLRTSAVPSSLTTGPHCAQSGCKGWTINTLTMASAPLGGATQMRPSHAQGSATDFLAPPTPGDSPHVTVTQNHATSETATLKNVHGPFELVLGESVNAGWQARLSTVHNRHSVSLGSSELIDGFANGWMVSEADLHRVGINASTHSLIVTLRWRPQRKEVAGIILSLVALVTVICLIAWTPKSRRRKRTRITNTDTDAATASATTTSGTQPMRAPTGAAFRETRFYRTRFENSPILGALARGLVAGLAGALFVAPWWGGVLFVATLLAQRLRTMGHLIGLAIAGLSCTLVVYLITQHFHVLSANGAGWPQAYAFAGVFVYLVVSLVGVDLFVGRRRHR